MKRLYPVCLSLFGLAAACGEDSGPAPDDRLTYAYDFENADRIAALPFSTDRRRPGAGAGRTDADVFVVTVEVSTALVINLTAGEVDAAVTVFQLDTRRGGVDATILAAGRSRATRRSQLVVPVMADGDYAVVVASTAGPRGTDNDKGYVLEVDLVDETLVLGDDDFASVGLGFSFPFNGERYDSVFVNSNGNLTFGAGCADPVATVSEVLDGPPRISAFFSDLAPNQGGRILVNRDETSWSVTFADVPGYRQSEGNTFTITLFASGRVTVRYGHLAMTDGLAGVSPGWGAADPGPSDLTADTTWPAAGCTYELFSSRHTTDLAQASLGFEP